MKNNFTQKQRSLKKRTVLAAVVAFLLIVSLLPGCGFVNDRVANVIQNVQDPQQDAESFDTFTDEIFRYYATGDSLTLNYTLAHPENFGIQKGTPTLGDYGTSYFEQEIAYSAAQEKQLRKFNRRTLSPSQQLTYDILRAAFADDAKSKDYLYYGDVLSPTIGFQANLPIILAEYHIYERSDFDDYLALIADVPAFFEKIIAFEHEKKEQGTFMAKVSAEDVIAQIESFIENPEENLLLSAFATKVDAFEGLSDGEKAGLKTKNRSGVLEILLPAYQELADSLTELNADNQRSGGLSDLPRGKEYYELLVRSNTGSKRSVNELDKLITQTMSACEDNISDAMQRNPDIYDQYLSHNYPEQEPEAVLSYLREAIRTDFPPLNGDEYELKYVDPSLEDFLSPAFFMIPPIDDALHNVIYINGGKEGMGGDMFTMLAHEAYPGHLYQIVYFKQWEQSPIRHILDFAGYAEGWATYVEGLSVGFAGFDPDLTIMLEQDELWTLCLYAAIDIGVNYKGWTVDDVYNYIIINGIPNRDAAQEMYYSMVAEPANYLKYTIGCIEFLKLRERAENALGSDFNAQEYHRFILETGPAQFEIVENRLDAWIAEQ